jgi:hypothetical protein
VSVIFFKALTCVLVLLVETVRGRQRRRDETEKNREMRETRGKA